MTSGHRCLTRYRETSTLSAAIPHGSGECATLPTSLRRRDNRTGVRCSWACSTMKCQPVSQARPPGAASVRFHLRALAGRRYCSGEGASHHGRTFQR
jgi:hypothetical protein